MITAYIDKLKDEYIKSAASAVSSEDSQILQNQLYYIIETGFTTNEKLADLFKPVSDILDEESKKLIEFLSILAKFNTQNPSSKIRITTEQKEKLESIKNLVASSSRNSNLAYLEKLINSLESEELFEELDLLEKSFKDLNIDSELQAKLLLEIMKNNLGRTKSIAKVIEPAKKVLPQQPVQVPEEQPIQILPIKRREPVKEIIDNTAVNSAAEEDKKVLKINLIGTPTADVEDRELLPETNLELEDLTPVFQVKGGLSSKDFNKLNDNNKSFILSYGNVENIKKITEKLRMYGVNINKWIEEGRSHVVSYILTLSSPEIIDNIHEILNKYEIDFSDFIDSNFDVLLTNKYKLRKNSSISLDRSSDFISKNYEHFCRNVKFFENVGMDLKVALRNSARAFAHNSDIIINNYITYKEVYGLPLNEKNLSCLRAFGGVRRIDNILEASRFGHEILSRYSSLICNSTESDITYIKYARQAVIINKNEDGSLSFRYNYNGKKSFDAKEHQDFSPELLKDNESYAYCKRIIPEVPVHFEIDESVFENKYIKQLEQNAKTSEYVYVLENPKKATQTIISRKKVLRVLSYLMKQDNITPDKLTYAKMAYALGYKSILSKYDVENIEKFPELIESKQRGLK